MNFRISKELFTKEGKKKNSVQHGRFIGSFKSFALSALLLHSSLVFAPPGIPESIPENISQLGDDIIKWLGPGPFKVKKHAGSFVIWDPQTKNMLRLDIAGHTFDPRPHAHLQIIDPMHHGGAKDILPTHRLYFKDAESQLAGPHFDLKDKLAPSPIEPVVLDAPDNLNSKNLSACRAGASTAAPPYRPIRVNFLKGLGKMGFGALIGGGTSAALGGDADEIGFDATQGAILSMIPLEPSALVLTTPFEYDQFVTDMRNSQIQTMIDATSSNGLFMETPAQVDAATAAAINASIVGGDPFFWGGGLESSWKKQIGNSIRNAAGLGDDGIITNALTLPRGDQSRYPSGDSVFEGTFP